MPACAARTGMKRSLACGRRIRRQRLLSFLLIDMCYRRGKPLNAALLPLYISLSFRQRLMMSLHRIFGLKSPKLTTEDSIRGFDIRLHGRTIAVEHSDSGHVYEYVWFRVSPHLRLPLVRENEMANIPAHRLMPTAKKGAALELGSACLLDNSTCQ